jgi:hypothetical protein
MSIPMKLEVIEKPGFSFVKAPLKLYIHAGYVQSTSYSSYGADGLTLLGANSR